MKESGTQLGLPRDHLLFVVKHKGKDFETICADTTLYLTPGKTRRVFSTYTSKTYHVKRDTIVQVGGGIGATNTGCSCIRDSEEILDTNFIETSDVL